jgi:hypothetical protein
LPGKDTSDSWTGGQGQALRVLGKIFLFERIFPKNLDRPESSALIRPKQGTTDRRMTQEKKSS